MAQRYDIYIRGIQTRWIKEFVSYNNLKELLSYIPGNPKDTIIDYCRDNFKIIISKSEFKPILKKRSYYSKNSLVIIMAIYNILKEEIECNDKHSRELYFYINRKKATSQTYVFFSLGDRPEKIFDYTQYIDHKYDMLINFLNNTYSIVKSKTNNDNIGNICFNQFPYKKFTYKDIDQIL
jgi:hypothetical protein